MGDNIILSTTTFDSKQYRSIGLISIIYRPKEDNLNSLLRTAAFNLNPAVTGVYKIVLTSFSPNVSLVVTGTAVLPIY